ncbi:MAG: TIGR04063 family PEP-CTERM/XrtA system glycosyltransferase [Burkholderiales bacterium]
MRILHLLDHSIPLHSGYTFRTLAILAEQRKFGWETFHLTSPKQKGCNVMEESVDGWHFFRTPVLNGQLKSFPVLAEMQLMQHTARRLEEIARQIRPDVLHAHSPVLNAIPALRISRRMNIPLVYEVRAFWEDAAVDHGTAREWGARYRLSRSLETWALKKSNAVTTICEGLKNDIVARGIAGDKVTVIPNAVDVEAFSVCGTADPELKRTLGLDNAVVLGFIGSFYAYEGLHILLRAFPEILGAQKHARILLVGGGPQERTLRDLSRHFGDRVVLTGRVPHDQIQRYYNLIDVLVYPRLSIRLTDLVTPLKPLEAMAQGRLVVASDVGGHRELIKDGETGILFKANDEKDLAQKVLSLISHPERWPQMKSKARSFVERERNWKVSVARYREIYETLMRGKAA